MCHKSLYFSFYEVLVPQGDFTLSFHHISPAFITWDVLVRISIAVKRHHDHGNSYKGETFHWVTYKEVQSIFTMVAHDGMQEDMVLRSSQEPYTLTGRHQEVVLSH